MFRALAALRVAVLAYAVAINAYRNNFEHPALAWSSIAAMVVATPLLILAYRAPERRGPALLAIDLALAVGLLLITPVAKGEWFHATIPSYWIVGALLAWAVRYGWRGGTAAAVLLGGVDLLSRADVAQKDWGNVFLMLLGGSLVGFLCESLKVMAAERDLAQREAAVSAERARLARVVHDGVLQVLALVQRRGGELGGEAGVEVPVPRRGRGPGEAHPDAHREGERHAAREGGAPGAVGHARMSTEGGASVKPRRDHPVGVSPSRAVGPRAADAGVGFIQATPQP